MSMPKTVRHINEKRALSALLREGSLSRADLARRLGLTRSTASSIASGLIREGLVRETGSAEDAGNGCSLAKSSNNAWRDFSRNPQGRA